MIERGDSLLASGPVRMLSRLLRNRSNALIATDQALASLTNAATLALMAKALTTGDFNSFALLQMIVMTSVGMVRALICEPMLALSTRETVRDPVPRLIGTVMVVAALLGLGACAWIGKSALVLPVLVSAPLGHDLLRHRAFAYGKPGWTLTADAVVLTTLVGGVWMFTPDSAPSAIALWGTPFLLGALVLSLLRPAASRDTDLGPIVKIGKFGLADTAIAALTWVVPLLIVQALMTVSSVGAFRLSQSVLGPLNIIASALVVQMLVRSEKIGLESVAELRRRAFVANRALIAISGAYVLIAGVALLVYAGHVDGALHHQLIYMFPVVAGSAVVASGSTAYMAVMRARAQQRRAVPVRAQILAVNAFAFVIGILGWQLFDWDPLIVPVSLTAIATVMAWRRSFSVFTTELERHVSMESTPSR